MMGLCLWEALLRGQKTRGKVDSEVSGKVRALLRLKHFATLSTPRLIHTEILQRLDTGSWYSISNFTVVYGN